MRALLLPAFTLTLAAQSPVALEAPIRKVRVHPDEAWVTRVARLHLPAGTQKMRVAQLPGGLTLDDLRILAKGPEGTRLGEVLVGPDRHVAPETAESRELLARLQKLHQRKVLLEGQHQAAEKALASLEQFQERSQNQAQLEQVLSLNAKLESRLGELLAQNQTREKDLEALRKETQDLESRWQMLRGKLDTNPNPSQVTAELMLPVEGDVEVELSYRTRKARWSPSYEARLSEDSKRLDLVLYAAVTQASGESWEGVQLELSDSRPSQMKELPAFKQFPKLGWKAPMPNVPGQPYTAVVEVTARVAGADATTACYSTSLQSIPASRPSAYQPPPPKPVPALEPPAQSLEEAKGLARSWVLEGPKSVPADGDAHRFRVLAEDLAPILQLVVAPRLDPTPIQMVRFHAPGRLPLFPGATVMRSVGPLRLGQGTLQSPPPGQPYELSFGPYQGLRVALEKVAERSPFRMTRIVHAPQVRQGKVLPFMKEEVLAHDPNPRWEVQERITLANDSADELAVEVQDRRVQSTHESVSLEPLTGATPPTREAAPGVDAWLLRIPPKGQAHLDLGWTIRAPKEGEITGLRELGFN